MRPPSRHSLVNEVVASLREAIVQREFRHHLPGVRSLSQTLHVSVPVVLDAVRLLEEEGLVATRHGARTRILSPASVAAQPSSAVAQRIVFIAFAPNWIAGSSYYQSVIHDLLELGYTVRVFECKKRSRPSVRAELEKLLANESATCWVLFGPPDHAQRFFAERNLPCLLNGICAEGIALPDFQVDYEALHRHAVHTLQLLGHRRIALLTTAHSAHINRHSVELFRQAVQQKLPAPWEPLHTYDNTTQGFTALLETLFRNRDEAPTALLIALVKRVGHAMTWLMHRGFTLPDEVSIISRDDESTLECLYPPPACYRQPESTARRFARAIVSVIENRLTNFNVRVVPEFSRGQSMARLKG